MMKKKETHNTCIGGNLCRKKRLLLLICVATFGSFYLFHLSTFLHDRTNVNENKYHVPATRYEDAVPKDNEIQLMDDEGSMFYGEVKPGEVVYALVLCGPATMNTRSTLDSSWKRQVDQVDVLLKTAAIFSKQNIHFILVTDSLTSFLSIKNITSSWPENFKQNLRITRRQIWSPPKLQEILEEFRPCSAGRLFLHKTLPDVDAVIYLDTDIFFLRSPEDLWPTFRSFNKSQVAGLSPCLYIYGPGFKRPFGYYGSSGINGGVAMMNLTRMRQDVSFNLTQTYLDIYKRFKKYLKFGDQDIMNHFYSVHPDMLYPINCSWNMRYPFCEKNKFPCPSAKVGISLIHGRKMDFFGGAPFFANLYRYFLKFDPNQNMIEEVPAGIDKILKEFAINRRDKCVNKQGFRNWLLKYPVTIINEKDTSAEI